MFPTMPTFVLGSQPKYQKKIDKDFVNKIWTILGQIRPYHTILDPIEPIWTIWDHCGSFWTSLEPQ